MADIDFCENLFGFRGQVAVVIGGTGVLGGALCEGLAQAGATVVVAGRSEERGKSASRQSKSSAARRRFLPVDVTQRESIEALAGDDVVKQHGRVDMPRELRRRQFADAVFRDHRRRLEPRLRYEPDGTHLGLPDLRQAHGRRRRRGDSQHRQRDGYLPLSRVFAYSASKAAVVNLTQNVAREFAPHSVRVNVLVPRLFPGRAEPQDSRQVARRIDIMRHTPMARFGEPQELIGATLLLLSPKAGSFITGAAIYVDGGFTAMTI